MKIQYYRFFLSKGNKQLSLFNNIEISREDLINIIFKQSVRIVDSKSEYSYDFRQGVDNYIYSQFGKHSQVKRHLPPERNYEIEPIEDWPNCNVFIYTDNNPHDGQIIAIEHKQDVFKNPITILKKWADKINSTISEYGYVLSINSIDSSDTFWDLAERYKGQIEEVTFIFASPNLFKTDDVLNKELEASAAIYNSMQTTISLRNPSGNLIVDKENPLMQQSIDYISNGGGEYKIKPIGKSPKTSIKRIKTNNIEIEDFKTDDPNALKTLMELIIKGGNK